MKRKPSQEIMNSTVNNKQTVRRMKSPQHKKTIRKQVELTSVVLHRHKVIKSREEVKGDSNNTTTTIKGKSNKTTRRIKEKEANQLGQREIMKIITSFATKIQRQWRVYSFRKNINQFIQAKQLQLKSNQQKSKGQVFELKIDNNKVRRIIHFEDENVSSRTNIYDRSKYGKIDSGKSLKTSQKSQGELAKSKSKKSIGVSKSSSSTPRNRVQKSNSSAKTPRQLANISQQLSKSLQKPLTARGKNNCFKEQERRASFNTIEEKRLVQNRRHSTGELIPLRPLTQKPFQIGKAFQIRIELEQKKTAIRDFQSPRIPSKPESEGTIAFRKNSSIQKIMRKCQKQLQMNKLRQMLSVENRYNKNEVTYRSYLQVIGKINQEHSTKLHQIKVKEGQLKSTLGQLLQLYKTNHQEGRFAEDQPQNSQSHLDVSLSFDRWDFNSSAKKSIDHLQFPQGNGSKVLSIESVLKELDQEDNGTQGEQKGFKKNKSLHMIQAIAERSKEISQKDVASFQEVPQNSFDAIAITDTKDERQNEVSEKYERVKREMNQFDQGQFTPPIIRSSQSIRCQDEELQEQSQRSELKTVIVSRNSVKGEETPSSQSLVITPGGHQQIVISEEVIQKKPETEIMNQLIFKEIKTQSRITNLCDPLVDKFRDIIIEKSLMTNIKLINSIKFLFARAREDRKSHKKIVKTTQFIPSFETDINAVNGWLLQLCHFMLDSYQHVVRQNLVKVKQPTRSQLFLMTRKEVNTLPLYETVPEYIFKDFSFFYIKSLSKVRGIKEEDYDKFSHLAYTFHRALIDSLNTALMDQLVTGREWIDAPWKAPQKFKAPRDHPQYAKAALQRAINVVSNWAEYGLGRLDYEDDFSEVEYRQFEQQKIQLVCRQQVFNIRLNPMFNIGNLLLQLSQQQFQHQLQMAVLQMVALAL